MMSIWSESVFASVLKYETFIHLLSKWENCYVWENTIDDDEIYTITE